MKLSMWTLGEYLSGSGYDVETNISEGLPCISLIRQSDERTYSTGYAEIFADGDDINVVNDMDRLTVRGAKMAEVANTLSEALNFYTRWEQELYECIIAGGTLQQLLNVAKVIFERPMFIKNDSTKTLAITSGYSSSVHPYWEELSDSGAKQVTDYQIVSMVSSDPEYKMAFADKYPSIRSSPVYGGMVLHANVFVRDRRRAEVVVLENGKPFNNGDVHLMNVFVELLSKYVAVNPHIFRTSSDVVIALSKFIEDGRIEREELQNISRYLNLEETDEMCLLVIFCEDKLDSPIFSALRERLDTQIKDAAVIQVNNQIVVLKGMKNISYGDVLEEFKKNIPRKGFHWGISFEFIHPEEIPNFYRQVCDVIEQAVFETKSYVSAYEAASHMISDLCMKDDMAKTYVHPDLYRLAHVDVKENTEYCETLFYYLLCGGNFTDASKIMNLHRNTMIYRMNKIREIVHSNLDDMANRELLLYSHLLLGKDY